MHKRAFVNDLIRVEIEQVIEASIEQVFDRLIDMDRYADWMPKYGLFVDCEVASNEEVRQGTVYVDKTRLGSAKGEVDTLAHPTEVKFHYVFRIFGKKVMEGWPGYRLRREGKVSTRLSHVATGQLHGPFKLLQPFIQRLAESERQRTVDALKHSCESEAGRTSLLLD